MTKISHSNTPTTGELTLDKDTRKFFPKKYHSGLIEGFFHLDCPSVRARVFAGRSAHMFTGERVLLLQQLKTAHSGPTVDEGAIFVGDATLLHFFENFPAAPAVVSFWRREMFEAQCAHHSLVRAHPLPTLAGRIARCFIPPSSGLGALIWERSEASLIDLRSPRNAYRVSIARPESLSDETQSWEGSGTSCENTGANSLNDNRSTTSPLEVRFEFASRAVDITRIVCEMEVPLLRKTPTTALVDMATPAFLNHYKRLSLDPTAIFYHALNFYALSEEKRSEQVFGRDLETRAEALRMLRGLFAAYLINQGPAANAEPLIWRPLVQSLSLLGQPDPRAGLRPIPLPQELQRGRSAICRELDFHPTLVDRDKRGEARLVARLGYEWARQFAFAVKRPASAHEVAFLAS